MSFITPVFSDLGLGEVVSLRSFGATELAVVRTGVMYWKPSFPQGDDWQADVSIDADGRAALDINGLIARTSTATVVVDPNSFVAEDDESSVRGSPLESALAALEVEPDAVTHVVITHGHRDHFSGVISPADTTRLRFPNAEHFFPAADMPTGDESGRHIDEVRRVMRLVQDNGRLQLVQGDLRLTDEVSLLAAPGETHGHQVVKIECDDELVYFLGDLVHFTLEVEHLASVGHPCNVKVLAESRQRVFADPGCANATFVFSHSRFPGWGKITSTAPGEWAWSYDKPLKA